nr:hypothetical protein CFP56_16578 [Quercus suber]
MSAVTPRQYFRHPQASANFESTLLRKAERRGGCTKTALRTCLVQNVQDLSCSQTLAMVSHTLSSSECIFGLAGFVRVGLKDALATICSGHDCQIIRRTTYLTHGMVFQESRADELNLRRLDGSAGFTSLPDDDNNDGNCDSSKCYDQ